MFEGEFVSWFQEQTRNAQTFVYFRIYLSSFCGALVLEGTELRKNSAGKTYVVDLKPETLAYLTIFLKVFFSKMTLTVTFG
jgi:hypothetical protein